MLFDYLAVRLNGPEGGENDNQVGTFDTSETRNCRVGKQIRTASWSRMGCSTTARPDPTRKATLTLLKATLDSIQLAREPAAKFRVALASGEATLEGNQDKLYEFLDLLDTFPFWFNIVTPRDVLTNMPEKL